MLYRPMRGLGLEGPFPFAFCCLGFLATAVAVAVDGNRESFPDLVGWGAGAVHAADVWLWRSCRWLRVDDETLEWKTPLTRGRVPLHEVRRISLDDPRWASIDIRGHRSLDVRVGDGFEEPTAAIVAGAPHVVIERSARARSPDRGPRTSAAAQHVRPAVRNQRQFLAESAKITDPRYPPVPVWVAEARLDERHWPGLLYGWANNPLGGGAGPRGLVVADQPDGSAYIGWALPEHLHWRT